jgi:hypothetical protein
MTKRPPIFPYLTLEKRMLWNQLVDESFSATSMLAAQTIKQGQEAWKRINSSPRRRQTYRDWQGLMDAYDIGSRICEQVAGKREGGRYNKLLSIWTRTYGFDDIPSPTRTYMRRVLEHQGEIETWRSTLPPEIRMRMNNPESVWKNFSEWKRGQEQSAS